MRILALTLFQLCAVASAQEGIYMQLPADREPTTGPTLSIWVRASGTASVDGVVADSTALSASIREHIRAHSDGAVAFGTERSTSYSHYIEVLDTIKDAFIAERDKVALNLFGVRYLDLKPSAREVIHDAVPLRISLQEPD